MDWIRFYYNNKTQYCFSPPSTPLIMDVSDIKINNRPLLDLAIESINQIVSKYPPPYRVFVSGGVDSQASLYAWHKSGVDYSAHTFIYDQNMNNHDIATIFLFANFHDITLETHHISHFDFLEKELVKYSKTYMCNSPHVTFYMKMCEHFSDGTIIFSGEPCQAMPWFTFDVLGLDRYRIITNKSIIPLFWISSSELAGKWIFQRRSRIKEQYKLGFGNEGNFYKEWLYQVNKIPVIGTFKKSGFDKYKIYYDNVPIDKKFFKYRNPDQRMNNRPYDYLYRYSLSINNPINKTVIMKGEYI